MTLTDIMCIIGAPSRAVPMSVPRASLTAWKPFDAFAPLGS